LTSTALDASRMLVEISLSWWRGGRRSYSSPDIVEESLRMRSVGSLRGLDSSTSCGHWFYWDSRRWLWAWAVNPISVSLFMIRVSCSIPICVALFRLFQGFRTPSVGKLGRRPRACLIALLRMPSMVVRCLSLNTQRCVAKYFDSNNCSIACVF